VTPEVIECGNTLFTNFPLKQSFPLYSFPLQRWLMRCFWKALRRLEPSTALPAGRPAQFPFREPLSSEIHMALIKLLVAPIRRVVNFPLFQLTVAIAVIVLLQGCRQHIGFR